MVSNIIYLTPFVKGFLIFLGGRVREGLTFGRLAILEPSEGSRVLLFIE
jgi:hypothetical protein